MAPLMTTLSNISKTSSRRKWITREFADALADKKPDPYLRAHDPALAKFIREYGAGEESASPEVRPYFERFIHFWREASIFGLPRTGPGQDETLLFLFEATFDLAIKEPEWAARILEEKPKDAQRGTLAGLDACLFGDQVTHESLLDAFGRLNAPEREKSREWNQDAFILFLGRLIFWTAVLAAHEIERTDKLTNLRLALLDLSNCEWGDRRAFARILRRAPHRAPSTSRARLFEHPLLRLVRTFYREDGLEAEAVIECLETQCLTFGVESEDDHVTSELTLAAWVRDVRAWALRLRREQPKRVAGVFREITLPRVRKERAYLRRVLGNTPATVDDIDAARRLLADCQRRRGHTLSEHRGELLAITASVLDGAIWLGWLFPNRKGERE